MLSKVLNRLASTTIENKQLIEEVAEFRALKSEINKARCVIEFDASGKIIAVNENALNVLGYTSSELVDQHHRALVSRAVATSIDYQGFWQGLADIKTQSGIFKLQDKVGNEKSLQGYYAPLKGKDGHLRKVVCYLTNITDSVDGANTEQNKLSILESAIEGASVAVMSVDRDFNITYANAGTVKLLKDNLTELRKFFPNLDPDNMLGKSIDMFHRNPEHQRKMLADPKNLPHTTVIKLGNLYIRLHITASFDKKGDYVGNTLEWREMTKEMSDAGKLTALDRVMGVIEFDLAGNIVDVNENFAAVTGYSRDQIIGNHHSMFIDAEYKASADYKEFWQKLGNGEIQKSQFRRFGKGGKIVWLEASYNPVFDANNRVYKVVKYATDITDFKLRNADFEGQLQAIDKVMGTIEFDLKGNILNVNNNFANVTGYSREEIIGKHHSMFITPEYKGSNEYKAFWEKLGSGVADSGRYHRVGKGGKDVWLEASYNPIFNADGKAFKVVKFATDITEQYKSARVLEQAVEESQSVIEDAKTGDLTNRVSLEGKTGAIASLCDGINALMNKMTEVVSQVREAGESINTAANEISTGNTDLSSRTEQQASSLEETASSMEELASTVKQNAENAKQANQLAAAASGVAVKGGQVVGNVVATMAEINSSAKKIEDIISVIDGIAFQTNILALNAAVEAARAGEQGRGFAVVAGEVRNLAQRSASAAKEIKDLITDSVSKTAEGTKLVESAGATMSEIVNSVQRVTDIMGEITTASQEQSSGIDQVNSAITTMDEVTQQNAALVEEAAAAAESLVEQASSLMETVGAFKLAGGNTQNRTSVGSKTKQHQIAAKSTSERRSPNSPLRNTQSAKSHGASKSVAKTGTNEESWEAF